MNKDIPRRCSSSSKSETVVPSSILPRRVVAPVKCRNASVSIVLPELLCDARTILRTEAVENSFIDVTFLICCAVRRHHAQ